MSGRPLDPDAGVVADLLAAWDEPDPTVRRQRLGSLFGGIARYTDPDDDVTGVDAVNAVMTRVRGQLPAGARFRTAGAITSHHEFVHFAWQLTGPDGATLATGRDVLTLGAGQIVQVVGFFDPPG